MGELLPLFNTAQHWGRLGGLLESLGRVWGRLRNVLMPLGGDLEGPKPETLYFTRVWGEVRGGFTLSLSSRGGRVREREGGRAEGYWLKL